MIQPRIDIHALLPVFIHLGRLYMNTMTTDNALDIGIYKTPYITGTLLYFFRATLVLDILNGSTVKQIVLQAISGKLRLNMLVTVYKLIWQILMYLRAIRTIRKREHLFHIYIRCK